MRWSTRAGRDDGFPFKGLASCGVAFYLAAALRTRLALRRSIARDLLDLVALGTIADLVPLVAENRILVAAGLQRLSLREAPGPGRAGASGPSSRAAASARTTPAFRLTPRLNAAGRLGEAQLALDLLLADDGRRRAPGRRAGRPEHGAAARPGAGLEGGARAGERAGRGTVAPALVVGAEGWHPGVVGIIAARLVDRFARPAIAIGFRDGEGRGSARTVRGVNLFDALLALRAIT